MGTKVQMLPNKAAEPQNDSFARKRRLRERCARKRKQEENDNMHLRKLIPGLAAAVLGTTLIAVPVDAAAQGNGKKNGHSKAKAGKDKFDGAHDRGRRGWQNDVTNGRDRGRRGWDDDDRRWEEERRREEWRREQDRTRSYNGSTTDWARREADRRQQTKNEWRNLAYVGGAVALLGLLEKDSRLVFAGAAGALYSVYRYEQDRKSQNRVDRARAYYFSQPYFYRDGVRYERRLVTRGNDRYYQFVRK